MKRLSHIAVAVAALVVSQSPLSAPAASSKFSAHLSGREEVPARETAANGNVKFTLSKDGTQLQYRLIVANIENVIAAHIHMGAQGANGPIVVTLYGPVAAGGGRKSGVLATGTISAADLSGDLAGRPLSDLIDAMRAGNTYVNVHTDDGSDPGDSRSGDFPNGEIRGQIR